MTTPGDRNLSVTGLDFNEIRDNFIEYLRGQEQFKDYNFEGSNMAVILDLLAYNTHYQAFYANMVANEMFLDSAVKRTSIVSRSKEIGYTPRSFTSPKARITLTISDDAITDSIVVLPRYTPFIGKGANGRSYTFLNLEPRSLVRDNNNEYTDEFDIHEGSVKTLTYVADSTNQDQRFLIPDINVDTKTLIVRVTKSVSDTTGFTDYWAQNTDFNTINGTTKVFFLQETTDGLYEVYFGDGVLGKKLTDGNVVIFEYLVTSGPEANGIGFNATYSTSLENASVEVVTPSAGGDIFESERSIKYYAPLSYQAQNRAVTALDYQSTVARDYANAESISVWGGEDNDPPFYGRVFISLKPLQGFSVSRSEKDSIIKSILKEKNLVTVTPIIIDPEYTFLRFDADVFYDSTQTSLTPSEVKLESVSSIRTFVDDILEKFNSSLKYSNLLSTIDETLPSITNSRVKVSMEKRFIPIASKTIYEFRFQNAIFHPQSDYKPVLSSNAFTYKTPQGVLVEAYLDDYNGSVRLYYINDLQEKQYFNRDIGTIDYEKGFVYLRDFAPVTSPAQEIKIRVEPDSYDVNVSKNNILSIDREDQSAIVVRVFDRPMSLTETTNTDFYTSKDNRVSTT
jgi:hypothetical protein